jgi:sulfur-carrier protein
MTHSVYIASPLRSYTAGAERVDAAGGTLAAVLLDLDRQFRGLRFRVIDEQDQIRRHMRIFVNSTEARQLNLPLQDGDSVHLIAALSGG